MTRTFLLVNLLLGAVLIALICVLETYTELDMRIQTTWFDQTTRQWCIPRSFHVEWKWLVYSGVKKLVSGVSIGAAAVLVLGWLVPKYRVWCRPGLILLLSCVICASILCGLREVTNVYCPSDLRDFNGTRFYQHILEAADPANGRSTGHCFPAGHASGGFAVMSLFFGIPSRTWRWAGLAAGLGLGWFMGLYQMLRGEHFLSHTLCTMIGAWMIVCVIVFVIDAAWREPRLRDLMEGSRATLLRAANQAFASKTR